MTPAVGQGLLLVAFVVAAIVLMVHLARGGDHR